ncbi:hypothetical protein [Paenibacillus sp. J45TS6]|uniref:hypothetical protein n=1 Tax=Paenibacillus sp. J45TS6 TaxID=2807196 RepID=UPI001BCF29CE|nr:hypothetical protein [Paenibacillus sp. J45TS6]
MDNGIQSDWNSFAFSCCFSCNFAFVINLSPVVPKEYVEKVLAGGKIETTYQAMGKYEMKHSTVKNSSEVKKVPYLLPGRS